MIIIGDPGVALGNTFSSSPYTTGQLSAGVAEHHRQATCPGACTESFTSTINVFAQFYHMHNYGSRMFTEKYATAAAGGSNLGVVGGRIDFWDNAFQQALPTSYTVAPGETLCVLGARRGACTCICTRASARLPPIAPGLSQAHCFDLHSYPVCCPQANPLLLRYHGDVQPS